MPDDLSEGAPEAHNFTDQADAPAWRLAWIFGSSRSGSTWLTRMLGDVPGAATIDDPHIGHHLGIWRPIPLAWAVAEGTPALDTLDSFKADRDGYFFSDRYREAWEPGLRRMIRDRFEAEARDRCGGRSPKAVFVKEPGSQAAEMLVDLLPGSRVVFLLRDGRDVVASWMAAYQDGSWAIDEGAFPVARQGRLPLVRWLATVWTYRTSVVRGVYRRLPPDRRTMLRYERMLEDPAGALERACAVAGLEPGAAELRRIAERHRIENVAEGERGPDKAIRNGRAGSWQTELSQREKRAAEEVMGETLREVGYGARGGADRVHALV